MEPMILSCGCKWVGGLMPLEPMCPKCEAYFKGGIDAAEQIFSYRTGLKGRRRNSAQQPADTERE